MKLKTIYGCLRVTGYITGVSGLILFLAGRRQPAEGGNWMLAVGGGLIGVMFISLILSYVLFTYLQIRRRR